MEKKKLLFVAISVGVFLTLTIGAAILIFTPKSISPAAVAVYPPPRPVTGITVLPTPAITGPGVGFEHDVSQQVDAVGLVRNNEDMPGLRPLPDGAGQQGGNFHITGQDSPLRPTETRITVPQPSTAAVPTTPPAGRAAPRATPQAPVQQPPRPVAQAAPATRPAASAASQPRVAAQTRVHNDFWVQTGAFSTVANAEGVKEALASKGIASIIDNRVIDGRPLFRVRVGPYTSMNEANYWLSLIRSIDGFEESQVRQTQSLR